MGLTVDPKPTYSTHILTISVQAHKPLQMIKALQVMQNAALRTATGCTQDTNIQHMRDEKRILPIHGHLQLHASQYKQKTKHPSHPLHKHTPYFNTPRFKKTLSLTTAATQQSLPQTPTQSPQQTQKQTCAIYIHLFSLGILPQEAITKYCTHLHHTLSALKRYFPASLVAPLPNSEPINHPSSNHIYTTLSPLNLWTNPAGMTALLVRWTEKLAGGPQAGTSDSPH